MNDTVAQEENMHPALGIDHQVRVCSGAEVCDSAIEVGDLDTAFVGWAERFPCEMWRSP